MQNAADTCKLKRPFNLPIFFSDDTTLAKFPDRLQMLFESAARDIVQFHLTEEKVEIIKFRVNEILLINSF